MITAFASQFLPKLPHLVREDIQYQMRMRGKRKNATFLNMQKFEVEAVKHGLKYAPVLERKFPFSDTKRNADHKRVHSSAAATVVLNHETIMDDERIERLCVNLVENFTRIIQSISIDKSGSYIDSLKTALDAISRELESLSVSAPSYKKRFKEGEEAEHERELEAAIRRCLDVDYLTRKFRFLRAQYIEYSQVALKRVGRGKDKRKYVSKRSFARWRKKQIEARQFVESMAVFNPETGESFDLKEVVKRTTANPENRRIELVVRTRGDEERAIDLGYVGLFVTWTLPSKYHMKSTKWNECTIKEAHQTLMKKWALARAKLAKANIEWFGLRVAEPHADGTPHAHMFLYTQEQSKDAVKQILIETATEEDFEELINKSGEAVISNRIDIKDSDPSKGTATGYIIKYISKNINGAHLPENDAEENAFSARAWASTHRIKQFQQSGAPCVGLWRQLRRANKQDTEFCNALDELRDHADNSRWSKFCELADSAKLAYESSINKYGQFVPVLIGIDWLGRVIETCSERYRLVKKRDLQRLQKAPKGAFKDAGRVPWSTENKCNSDLKNHLKTLTGWSLKGVSCLIAPLLRGARVQIDRHMSIKLIDNRLVTYTKQG